MGGGFMMRVLTEPEKKLLEELRYLQANEAAAHRNTQAKNQEICREMAPFKAGDRVRVTSRSGTARVGVIRRVTFEGFESSLGYGGFTYLIRQLSGDGVMRREIHLCASDKMEAL
jgi:hypothetical protein